jgi:hypothetical protein
VLRQVDLAVVHGDGLRRDRRQQRRAVLAGELAGVDDDPGRQAVVRRPAVVVPAGRAGQRPDGLEQHGRRVDRLG